MTAHPAGQQTEARSTSTYGAPGVVAKATTLLALMNSIRYLVRRREGEVMGDRHHDPTDHFRTTQPHAGITMKDNLLWPGFIPLAVALSGMISTAAVAAYGHYEWLATTVLIAVLGTVAGALWVLVELRRVARIDAQWLRRRCRQFRRQRAASSQLTPNLVSSLSDPNV